MAKCNKEDVLRYIDRLKNVKSINKEKSLEFVERFITFGEVPEELDSAWKEQLNEERLKAETETLSALKDSINQLFSLCRDRRAASGLQAASDVISDKINASGGSTSFDWENAKSRYIASLNSMPREITYHKVSKEAKDKKYKKLRKSYDKLEKKYEKLKKKNRASIA